MNTVKKKPNNKTGSALLVVLFIVMAVTVVSLGFMARSDVQLACGRNMTLWNRMDYLAESGLVHARGLILNPQDVNTASAGYWTGASHQSLAADSDYYDVNVTKLGTDECDYQMTSAAYRQEDNRVVGRSSLTAELRLDPVVAYWTGATAVIPANATINGDVYCGGELTHNGTIDGDIFADGSITGSGTRTGQRYQKDKVQVTWPGNIVGVSDFASQYYIGSAAYSVTAVDSNEHPGGVFVPTGDNPAGVRYCNGDVNLPGNVNIVGTLVVDGNLTIRGANNSITAQKNFPALLVTGPTIVLDGAELAINGLAILEDNIVIDPNIDPNTGNFKIEVVGGLFMQNGGIQNAVAGVGTIAVTAAPSKTALQIYSGPTNPHTWRQAGGAFFKYIRRN